MTRAWPYQVLGSAPWPWRGAVLSPAARGLVKPRATRAEDLVVSK